MEIVQSVYLLFQQIFFILVGLFGIGFLIGFHELGHFIFCKFFNIHTPSFSIGMGPRIWTKKIGDTEFALSAIPLGGYVEIAGAAEVGQGEQKEASRKDQFSFAVKPYWQKLLVMSGGILFNMAFAYLAFIGLLLTTGIPKTLILYPMGTKPTIQTIIPKSAAEKYHLQKGDIIIAFNNDPVGNSAESLIKKIESLPNQPLTLTIERQGIQQPMDIVIGSRPYDPSIGSLGAIYEQDNIAPHRHVHLTQKMD